MSRKANWQKMKTTTEKNSATFTHLSALTQYFIPFEILFFQYYFGLQKKTSLNLLITVENKLNFQLSFIVHNRTSPYRHPGFILTF
jgi:uncharacterized Tic20 family protein